MIDTIVLNAVVRNEERRIGPMLAMTLPLLDGAIIVDQDSTDATADIARAFGCTVIPDRATGYCEPSRKRALEATVDHAWVLVLDADEFLLPQFSSEMRRIDEMGYVGAHLRFSHWVAGEHQGDGDPHYRFARKANMGLDPGLHTAPYPISCRPEQVYSPDYPAILHVKSWTEQLAGEEGYEAVLQRLRFPDHKLLVDLSCRNLVQARKYGLSGADLDAMSITERHLYQFGMWR